MASESPSKNKQRPGKDGDARMNPRGNYKGTREEWLRAVLLLVAPWLDEAVKTVWETMAEAAKKTGIEVMAFRSFFALHRVRIGDIQLSCSLLAAGMKNGRYAGHVQYPQSTKNKKHEIRIGVQMGGTKKADSVTVASIIMHEVLHTMTVGDGHRGMFPIIGKAAGLTGKPTAMNAYEGTPLFDRLNAEVVSVLGKYPHKSVKLTPRGQRNIGSRSIKAQCPECECIIRLTRVWLEKVYNPETGEYEPVCPMNDGVIMVVESQ